MIPNFQNEYTYNMVYPFPAAPTVSVAAAGGTGASEQRMQDNRYYFIGTHIMGEAWLSTASVGTSLIGTTLADVSDPSPPAAVGNILPSKNLLNCTFARGSLQDADVFRPFSTAVGSARFPLILANEIVLAPGNQTQWNFINNASVPIAGCIVIMGRQVPKAAYESWLNSIRK